MPNPRAATQRPSALRKVQKLYSWQQIQLLHLSQSRRTKFTYVRKSQCRSRTQFLASLILGPFSTLLDKLQIFPEWHHRIQSKMMPNLQTAVQNSLHMDGKILLHIRFGTQCTRTWFGIIFSIDVDMLRGTSFIDRFIHGIFHSEQNLVPRHTHPVGF